MVILLYSVNEKDIRRLIVNLTSGAKMMKNIRNHYRQMYVGTNLAYRYWKKVNLLCQKHLQNDKTIGCNELFRFYKHKTEQRFKKPIDGRLK